MWFFPTRATLLFLLFLSFNQVFLVQGNEICSRTFRQSGTIFNITCPDECIRWPYEKPNGVFGTSVYHPDSLICLSALHAGVARIGAAIPLTFNKNETKATFVGTVSNRVISETRFEDVGFYFQNERFILTDRAEEDEMVMVYNSFYSVLVACLRNSKENLRRSPPKPEITTWNYSSPNYYTLFEDSEYASIHAMRIMKLSDSIQVLRCIGSNNDMDMTAILGHNQDQFVAIFPTVTASLGEAATLQYRHLTRTENVKPLRSPKAPISGAIKGTNIEIASVSLSDQGLYKGHETSNPSYARLIVRGCKKDRSGANCSDWCRDCLNNGECDSDSGECVCSPGTMGKNCQIFCPVNKFGADCQLDCKRIRSLWGRETETCYYLTFCLRDPKGCSCYPGRKAPECFFYCTPGSYGTHCLSRCNYCNGNNCDRNNGRCGSGCKNPNLCNEDKAPLNLPRFRKPPLITDCDVRGCAVTFSEWDSDYDDGELTDTDGELRYEISIENLNTPSENADIPTYPGQRREFSYNFFRGISYNITLNILTNRGKPTEEYNMRIQSHHLTLPCLDSYSSVNYNVTHIWQTGFVVEWVHRNGPLCPKVRYRILVMDGANTILNTSSDSSVYVVDRLTADTLYQIKMDDKTRKFTTLPYPPASPAYVRINVTSDKTCIAWDEVEDSSNYEVTIQSVQYDVCKLNINPNRTTFELTKTELVLDYKYQLSYSAMYNVCVVGVNRAGKSSSSVCQTFSTSPKEVPDIEWQELSCSARSQSLDCNIGIASECQKFHGPNITSVWKINKLSKCPNGTPYEDIFEDIFTYSTSLTKTFSNLDHFNEYSISVYLKNSIGQSISSQSVFSTMESNRSGIVQDFKVSRTTNNSLFLEWLIPCPSLASIQSYKLSYRSKDDWQSRNVNPTSFCESPKGYICYQLEDLNFNVNYSLKVQSCKRENSYACSEDSKTVNGLTTSTGCAPGIYGTECLDRCNYCNGNNCDCQGRCHYGCKNAKLCNEDKAPLNLPRFRKPPLITDCDVRGCAVTFSEWDSDYDDGELTDTDEELRYEISIENLNTPSENADIPTYPGQRREFSYNFFRGISYNITLNILTNRGKATEEYSMRIQSHHLTLPCLDSYSSVNYNVTHIWQTGFVVEWVHRNGPLCPKVRYRILVMDGANTLLNTSSDSSVYVVDRLTADTLYQIKMDDKTRKFTTLPYPPAFPDYIRINVTSDKTCIAWDEVEDSSNYEVTIESVQYDVCKLNINPNRTRFEITETELVLDYKNHLSYSAMYNVCVVGVNRAGKSSSSVCQTFSTSPKEVPDIEWQELSCSARSQSLDCNIGIASECQKFHGPNITSVWKIKKLSKCPNGTPYEDIFEDIFTYSTHLIKTFSNLDHYEDYSISVYLKNSIGQSISSQGVFSTMESNRSGIVQDFKVSRTTNNSLFLEWLIPCPPLASIQSYKLSYRSKDDWLSKNVNPTSHCESSKGYICYQIEDLFFNVSYKLKVQSCKRKNAYECSEDSETIIGLTTPIAPGKPKLMPMNALHGIDVVVTTSQYLGEQPSCWASLHKGNLLQQNSSKYPVVPQKEYTFPFTGLRPSSKYLVKSGCCNSKACSTVTETVTNTKLAELVLTDEFLSGTITNTTIVIKVPVIESGDAEIYVVIVVVNGYGEERTNITDLYDEYLRTGMEINEEELGTKLYVAGVVENGREFTIGSGDPPNNPPLVFGEVYSVIPLIELKLNNDRLLVEEPKITFTAGGSLYRPNQYLWMVLLTVILVVIALLLIGIFAYRSKKAVRGKPEDDKRTQNDKSKSALDENASPDENEKLQPALELQVLPTSSKDNSQIDSLQQLLTTAAVTEQPLQEHDDLSEKEYDFLPQRSDSIQSEMGYSRPLFTTFGV